MTDRPIDISPEALALARDCIEPREFNAQMPKNTVARIARAIIAATAAEREACAALADEWRGNSASRIAAEIRKREGLPHE